MRSAKGGQFEREFCRTLSLWYSKGELDDIFWRTSNSGGRATVRRKNNARTFGQQGDVQAVDPIGAPLMRHLCFELKRGYSNHSFADALDCTILNAPQDWEKFMVQSITAAEASHASHWFLVQRRDQRQTFVFFPHALFVTLGVPVKSWPRPFLMLRARVRGEKKGEIYDVSVCGTTWKNFAQVVDPSVFS